MPAIQDPAAQLLDADPEQILVLTFDLPPSRFVFRQLLFGGGVAVVLLLEDVEAFLGFFLLDLLRHRRASSCQQ
jgi:hypothetical protein